MGTHPIFESDFDCLTEPIFVMSEGVANKNSLRITNMKERLLEYKGLIVITDSFLNSKDPYRAALAKCTLYSALYAIVMWINPSLLTQACLQVALYLTFELAVSKLAPKFCSTNFSEENEASFHRFCTKIIKIKDNIRANLNLIVELKVASPMKFYFIALPALLFSAYLGTVAYLSTYVWCALVEKQYSKFLFYKKSWMSFRPKCSQENWKKRRLDRSKPRRVKNLDRHFSVFSTANYT